MTTQQQQKLNARDQSFVVEAARAGTAEIKLGQLANARASREEVKRLSRHMVEDHTQANQELMKLASRKGAEVREELDPAHMEAVSRLSTLSGAQFDREYIDLMVKDHEQVIAEFETEARQGEDEELKYWAGQTLPKLQHHLRMARDLVRWH